MPYYQFTIPAGGASAQRKAQIAAAITRAHQATTGAPSAYVNCAFVEVAPGSLYVGDAPVEHGRMIGLIRRGRSEETKRSLVAALAEAWSSASGEPIDQIAVFLHEVPGYQVMEHGSILPEAWEDETSRMSFADDLPTLSAASD